MQARIAVIAALAAVTSWAPAQTPDFYDLNTVRDVYLTFAQPNWWAQLTANYGPEINIAATMQVDGVTYPNVGVRFRGNTSYTMLPPQPQQGWEKKSFNIEMDWLVPGQAIQSYDSLNLNNGFHDPTFLREVLTYYVMRRHGVAPRANWVRLHLNGTYWGVYINVQQPNKDMMRQWFRTGDGNRYRAFPTFGGFGNGRCAYTQLNPNVVTQYLQAYQAKEGDGTDLMTMCTVLNATTPATPQSTLLAKFNVDSFLRYAAVMNVSGTLDSYLESGKDHFLYIDDVHGDGSTFPFDLNESFLSSTSLAPDFATTNVFRPGFTKTLQFADWLQRYKAHLNAVVQQTFNPTHLTPLAQQWHAMIAADVAADPKKIYSTALFTQNLNATVSVPGMGGGQAPGIVPFIQARSTFLGAHAYVNAPRATLTNLAHSPQQPNPTQAITFTVDAAAPATGVNLYWRRVGPFQKLAMFDDGLHGDGAAADGTWGAGIASQAPGTMIDYYAEAVTATGAASYAPFTAETEVYAPKVQVGWPVVPSPVVINEFVAQNQNGPVDEGNEHEDWLELYNTSNAPVDISGKWLSDSLVVLKWQLPANTIVPANSVLRIWCDEELTEGPMHADFKLSTGGESIAFWDATGTTLHDAITFGQQSPDVSTGRLVDGGLPWVTFPAPTFEARNEITACGQRTYGAQLVGAHGVQLAANGTLQVGSVIGYAVSGGPANGVGLAALALGGDHIPLDAAGIPEVLLLSPGSLVLPTVLSFDAGGAATWSLPLPNVPAVAGVRVPAQTFTWSGAAWDSTRAVEAVVCP